MLISAQSKLALLRAAVATPSRVSVTGACRGCGIILPARSAGRRHPSRPFPAPSQAVDRPGTVPEPAGSRGGRGEAESRPAAALGRCWGLNGSAGRWRRHPSRHRRGLGRPGRLPRGGEGCYPARPRRSLPACAEPPARPRPLPARQRHRRRLGRYRPSPPFPRSLKAAPGRCGERGCRGRAGLAAAAPARRCSLRQQDGAEARPARAVREGVGDPPRVSRPGAFAPGTSRFVGSR